MRFGRRRDHERPRRLLTSAASMIVLCACTCGGDCTFELFPSGGGGGAKSTRTLAFEDGRRYEKGVRRYDLVVEESVILRQPEEQAPRTSRLHVVLEERVTKRGDDPVVELRVESVEAEGEAVDAEVEAAGRRTVRVTGKGPKRTLEFPSSGLGDAETIRIVDLALLGHLMAPAAPADDDGPVPRTAPDDGRIFTQWAAAPLDLKGQATVAARTEAAGRHLLVLDGIHRGETSIATGEPAVEMCGYRELPSIFGPIDVAQRATVHRSSGLLLSSTGTGTMRLAGQAHDHVPSTGELATALDVDWHFEERLVGPWPGDPGLPWARWLAVGLLAVVVVAHGTWLLAFRPRLLPEPRRPRSHPSDAAYIAAGWPS